MDHKSWKILNEMGTPDYLTCPLRNLYAGQEATVRTGYRTRDLKKKKEQGTGSILGKEYVKAVYGQSAYLTSTQREEVK